jgi:molybdopterin-guanine dinucleotide biosynthesis protein A
MRAMNKLWSALILTGGTSNRFGSDKSEAIFNGKALIDFLISSIPVGVRVVVVGPDRDEFPSTIQIIKEDPPGGGPVAGIAAGLPLIETEYVAVLATDMPYSTGLVPLLLAGLSNEVEAVVVVDREGFQQPFSGLYRVSALLRVLGTKEPLTGRSMRSLLVELKMKEVSLNAADSHLLLDIDTRQDLISAEADTVRHTDTHNESEIL